VLVYIICIICYYYEKTMSPPLIIIANLTAANDITIWSCAATTMNIPQSVCVLVGAICLLKKTSRVLCLRRRVCVCRVWSTFADEDKKKIEKKNHRKDNRKRRPVNSIISYALRRVSWYMLGMTQEWERKSGIVIIIRRDDTWPRRKCQ